MPEFPDGAELLIAVLAPIIDARPGRASGDPLPSAQVRRASGGDDGLVDTGRYGVSVFADSELAAMDHSKPLESAIRAVAPRFGAQAAIVTKDGTVVWVDSIRFVERFRPEQYAAEPNVFRVRAVIEVALRLQ